MAKPGGGPVQTPRQESIPDSYQAYVEARRQMVAEEPDPYVSVRLSRDDVNMLLDLISVHAKNYGPKTRDAALRCTNALVASLRT